MSGNWFKFVDSLSAVAPCFTCIAEIKNRTLINLNNKWHTIMTFCVALPIGRLALSKLRRGKISAVCDHNQWHSIKVNWRLTKTRLRKTFFYVVQFSRRHKSFFKAFSLIKIKVSKVTNFCVKNALTSHSLTCMSIFKKSLN